MILRRENPPTTISVPNHAELRKGTLRAIIRQAGLTVEEFVECCEVVYGRNGTQSRLDRF
jgi:hypothetical protein